MSKTHTPGPWLLIREGGRDASAVATLEPAPETMTAPNYWTVASTNGRRDEWAANARLIAAAPELLECLQDVLQSCIHTMPSASPLSKRCVAAIARATGEKT